MNYDENKRNDVGDELANVERGKRAKEWGESGDVVMRRWRCGGVEMIIACRNDAIVWVAEEMQRQRRCTGGRINRRLYFYPLHSLLIFPFSRFIFYVLDPLWFFLRR